MNKIIIDDVKVNKNRLDCYYTVKGEWEKYFNKTEPFFVEYSKSINEVPKNIAVIPFLCNVLPVAWLFDAEIVIDEIDKDFYEAIDEFKQGYIQMYPQLDFRGRVTVKRLVGNTQKEGNNCAAFFSGGVDAHQTLISHIDEKPILVTLWGSDVKFEDTDGWKLVEGHTIQTANNFGLDYLVVKSSFRRFLDETLLGEYVKKVTGDNWWHGFQHGIGLIGHMAPYAYKYQIKKVYIASSFTIAEKGKVTCASDPSIDNFVRFCGCRVVHDGYEYNRQGKIKRISNYVRDTGQKVQLRVCWKSTGGTNCCHCEKCYRTILGIIANKEDPREYGFEYSDEEFPNMMNDFKKRTFVRISNYVPIQKAFRENYSIDQVHKSLRWFYKIDINKINKTFGKYVFRAKRKVKRFFKK